MARSACSPRSELEEARLHVARWMDLSRRKIDVCLLSAGGEMVEEWASPPDADGVRGLARRAGAHGLPVRGVIESMTGSRFVHDRLEELGWDVLIADAAQSQGPGAAGVQDRQDRRAGARCAVASRPGAGDLAARSTGAPRARAGTLSDASGQASLDAQASHPRDADLLRAPVPGHGSVRCRGPRVAGPPRRPATVARHRRCQPAAH